MIDLDDLLNMVATEAHEGPIDGCVNYGRGNTNYEQRDRKPEPSFRFDLELVENPDGTQEWKE